MITYMSISRNYLGYSIKLKVLLTPPILVLGITGYSEISV